MKFNAENNKERSLSCRSAVSVVAQRSQPCLYQLHVLSAMLSWWSLALFSLWIVPFCPSPSLPYREEKLLRHVAMVAKFLDDQSGNDT